MIFVERKILVKIFPLFSLKTCAHFSIHLVLYVITWNCTSYFDGKQNNCFSAFIFYFNRSLLTRIPLQLMSIYWNMNSHEYSLRISFQLQPHFESFQHFASIVLCGTFLPYSLMKFINFQFSLLLYLSLSSSPSLRFVSISFSRAVRLYLFLSCGSIFISNWMWAVY